MKLEFFKRAASEQSLIIRETAARRGLLPVMVEKDFWVSWTLAVLFAHLEFGGQLVFKGGTSLSKVFGVIGRFSEDIDLSVSPAVLGISEESVEQADSRNKRTERMQELEAACIERVRERFVPELERIARESLGERTGGKAWMEFQVDAATHSPVVLFHYPSNESTGFEYLERSVKMEFGSLTDQRPVGTHAVKPWMAEEFPKQFADFRCELVALGTGADVLGEGDDFARGASPRPGQANPRPISHGIIPIWRHWPGTLLPNVRWLATICGNGWRIGKAGSSRQTGPVMILARPGTLRLAPPEFRLAELGKDYGAMKAMFLAEPPPFESVIKTVLDLEHQINGRTSS